jgi:cleavage stimulation factor subunit 2
MRNLNGYDVGGRALRVDRADQEMQSAPVPMAGGGTPSLDAVNATLAGMGNTQLLEVMTQMKTMATNNPEQTRQLLQSNPSLAYALFQAMVMMNLIDPTLIQVLISSILTLLESNECSHLCFPTPRPSSSQC